MKTPKAVVFDLGKVLLDFDYGIAIKRLLSRCRGSATEMKTLIDQSPLLLRYETGELTTDEFFTAVREATGFRGDQTEFAACFADIFTDIPEMTSLQEELRQRGVPTYIFSNTNELAVQHIRRQFPFFQHFNGYVFSYEHHALKPDPRLYEVVETMTGWKGAQLFYLDDRPENAQAGANRGWQTCLHLSPGQSRAALREAGLLG